MNEAATMLPLPITSRARVLLSRRLLLGLFVLLILIALISFYHFAEDTYLDWFVPVKIPGVDVSDSLSTIHRHKQVLDPLNDGSVNESLPHVFLFMPIDRVSASHSMRGCDFCRSLQSVIVSGWSPIIFNWNVKGRHLSWAKPFGLSSILNSPIHTTGMKDDDLIFMIDSWDVWLQLSPTTVARRFREFDQGYLLAGAEKACWPNPPRTCEQAPPSPLLAGLYHDNDTRHDLSFEETAPRYANSGTVIGRLDVMKRFYDEITTYMQSDEYEWKNFDDQGAFNDFLAGGKLKLDYYSRLFWPIWGDWPNLLFLNTPHPPPFADHDHQSAVPWHLYPPLGNNRITGEVPVALHFNSKPKVIMDQSWGKSWWNSERQRFRPLIKSRMKSGKVRFVTDTGYREQSVKELCPKLEIWKG